MIYLMTKVAIVDATNKMPKIIVELNKIFSKPLFGVVRSPASAKRRTQRTAPLLKQNGNNQNNAYKYLEY